MASKRRTLSPAAWFKRCVDACIGAGVHHPCLDECAQLDGQDLIKALSAYAEAYDAHLGDPQSEDWGDAEWSAVQRRMFRTALGSLKKFRQPLSGVSDVDLDRKAIRRFRCNNLKAYRNRIPKRFRAYMQEFLAQELSSFWEEEGWYISVPRFGNGAVYEKAPIVKRWSSLFEQSWIDPRMPTELYSSWGGTGLRAVGKGDSLARFEPSAADNGAPLEFRCRLKAVPKDWNKKRLITVEPYLATYLQQTYRQELLASLVNSKCGDLRAMARCEFLGSSDPQERHRRMALEGSMDGSLATLDLSDASDFISWNQVRDVFPPLVVAALERARSTRWVFQERHHRPVRSGRIWMFAGMGNALTFTVETLMFHAACHAIARYHRIKNPRISVFGDDIVCATSLANLIVSLDLFSEFGWTINRSKSFYTADSRFRESCGVQAYKGEDVTLLRYMGDYDGTTGAKALADLISRVDRLGLSSFLLTEPWQECQDIPNLWSRVDSGICTQVDWWPEHLGDCEIAVRKNEDLQRIEVRLPHLVLRRRFVPIRQLGCVYGAISGQLKWKTALLKRHGRKVAGVWVDTDTVDAEAMRWTPILSQRSPLLRSIEV